MSKISITALGGLNENGKNMYVIEVDKNIFVFEAGLKYADEFTLGIDYIIPNIEYLKKNKKRIKGIFLTHGHDENVGALSDIIKDLDGIKIYAAKFTLDVVRKELENEEIVSNNLVEIKANKAIDFDGIKIFPVNLSHSIPDNLGYALYTSDGVIFYASDFVFDSLMRGAYKTDLGKLAYIGKQGVLCLLTESIYADKVGHTAPNHRTNNLIRETLNKEDKRIIFSILNSHIYRIQELFNEVAKTNRKVVIMGKMLQNLINDAINNHYLKVDKNIIGDLSNINDDTAVILISDGRKKPYSNIIKILNGYDKFIQIKPTDTVFLATPIYEGREKTFYQVLDSISKMDANIVTLSPKKYLSHHASSEDLMMMIDLMNPKYYFPVKGEYRCQVANADLAYKVGVPRENIILKQNGEMVTFKDGKLVDDFKKVPSGSILIDGDSSDDIGEVVLRDREMLSDNGIMIISATLNKKTKKIIAGPEILTRGFIYVKDSADLLKEIKDICSKIIDDNTHDNFVEFNKIKTNIRDELGRFLSNQTGNKPMIITVIGEV